MKMIEDKITEYEQVVAQLGNQIRDRVKKIQTGDPLLQELLGELRQAKLALSTLKELRDGEGEIEDET